MKPVTSPPKPDAVQRQWPRRLAVALSVAMVTGMILLAAFSLWVVSDTVPVVVVDERGNPVGGVAIQPVVVIDMVDAMKQPSGKVVIFDIEGLRKVGYVGDGPLVDPNTWRVRTRVWASRFTQPFGIVMAWDRERPVFTGAGSARVPDSPHLIAVSTGDLKAEPEEVFLIDAGSGRRTGETPAKIVMRRAPPPPAWLDKRVTWSLQQPTLEDFGKAIESAAGTSITWDWQALAYEGFTSDGNLYFHDFSVRDLPLRSALNVWLNSVNLTYIESGDTIRITSQLEANTSSFETRLYLLGDLLGQPEVDVKQDAEELKRLIEVTVHPNSWQSAGGAGDLFVFVPEQTLLVCQTQEVHRKIAWLLRALRRGENLSYSDGDRRAREGLAKPINFDFRDEPLDQTLRRMGELAGIENVLLDRARIEDGGLKLNTPVNLRVENKPLAAALVELLGPFKLATLAGDDMLVVVSDAVARQETKIRVYPAADLLHKVGQADKLTKEITLSVAPTTWSDVGGIGNIEFVPNRRCLVVRQTDAVHDELELFLKHQLHDSQPTEAVPGDFHRQPR